MNVYKAASRIRLLSPLPSANYPDNWLTVASQSTVWFLECYDEKPDGLTVFLKFNGSSSILVVKKLLIYSLNI